MTIRTKIRNLKPAPRASWPDIMTPADIKNLNIFPCMGIDTIYSLWGDKESGWPGKRAGWVHIVYVEDLIKWLDGDDSYLKCAPRFAGDADWTTDEDVRRAL